MTAIWKNPEFVRSVRSQLRPGKAAATVVICAAISLVIAFALSQQGIQRTGPYGSGIRTLEIAFWLQALMLAAGGAIACVNSIQREKDQNTFDYQRVTRMTPLELALGKLFGAPVFAYFVFLCLMPLAVFGAVIGRRPFATVLAAYAALLAGSLAIHALALLMSLLSVRGSHMAGILVLLVILPASSAIGPGTPFFGVYPFGPFYAGQMITWGERQPLETTILPQYQSEPPWAVDYFLGHRVYHAPLLVVIDLIFALWFLLALVRNIKRDPNYYEILSPLQALGFALFINFLLMAFFQWSAATPFDGQSFLLTLNMILFFCLGLGAIRNREQMRRILRTREGAASWLDLAWPAPLLIAGTAAAGLLVVLGVTQGRNPAVEWNAKFAILRVLFFVAWITRDIQFLQWMSLRRGKHPLVMGLLYLVVFYVCVSILLGPLGVYSKPELTGFSAFFFPSAVYLLDHSAWFLRPAIWGAALVAQVALIVVFIGLQRQTIDELNSPTPAPADVPVPAQT